MSKTITVPLPLNISDSGKYLFEPYRQYDVAPQKVKVYKNVFVANSGFCLNSRGLIRECHHAYPSQYNYYLNEVSQYYYDAQDHPEKLLTFNDDKIYLAIHHPWFNYYHWICESIFRLWLVRTKLDGMILVLPEYYRDADFIMGSLEPFGIKNIFFIPEGKSLLVRNLCLPQLKPLCDAYNARQLKQVAAFYRDYVWQHEVIRPVAAKRLYISRLHAKRRQVVNEAEMLPVLKKYGFTIFYPEKHTFLEQVAIFSQVKYLVGMHGSGLTNLLFVPPGASVLELHKSRTNELDHPSPLFWYMADALNVSYYHQLCETHGREDYFEGDYLVDTELFGRNLALMLST